MACTLAGRAPRRRKLWVTVTGRDGRGVTVTGGDRCSEPRRLAARGGRLAGAYVRRRQFAGRALGATGHLPLVRVSLRPPPCQSSPVSPLPAGPASLHLPSLHSPHPPAMDRDSDASGPVSQCASPPPRARPSHRLDLTAPQRSTSRPPPCRTRSTSSQRPSPRQENKTQPATPAGPSPSLPPYADVPISLLRARKVKCNQIPGQDKVRPSPPSPRTPLISSTVPGKAASPSLPLRCARAHCASADSTVSPRTTPARESHACLPWCEHSELTSCTPASHFIQQATTEKKRNAAAAKRPRTLSTSSAGWVYFRSFGHPTHLTLRQRSALHVPSASIFPSPPPALSLMQTW